MHPRIKSFIYAFKGMKVLFTEEPHARFHVFAAIMVIAAGLYFNISSIEWLALILCIGAVFTAEAFNTAIENLGDAITIEENNHIRKAKDVAAAGVLLISITAAITGAMIFLPYFF
jgi:diacylglycerol kinase (ATP)